MPHVAGRAAVLGAEIIGVCRERTGAFAVAVCPAVGVVDAEGRVPVQTTAHGNNQLVLIEAAGRIVLEVVVYTEWPHAAAGQVRHKGPRQWRIDGAGAQQMQSASMTESNAGGEVVRQRSFDTDCRLHRVRRLKIRSQSVDIYR